VRIVMVSSEVETFARTGGLGDAVYGLARALARLGHDVVVATPLYGTTPIPPRHHWWYGKVGARVGWGPDDVWPIGVCEVREDLGAGTVRFCLLAEDRLFGGRRGIYGDADGTFGDNDLRFAVLSRGGLEVAARIFGGPENVDVVHAHDWHAALATIYARTTMGDAWRRVRQVFTIHNLAYQGILGPHALDLLSIPRELFHPGCLEHFGDANLVKAAITLADVVTTVSPTYAKEIQRPSGGFGIDGVLRAHRHKLIGIVNGVEVERFDPRTDPAIAVRYGPEDVDGGKWANKQALAREMGLDPGDGPLFGVVSRLTAQKGVELLVPCIPQLVEHGARVAILGSGEPWLEEGLRDVAWRYGGRVAARIAFDAGLAQRIYAASDFVCVPSRFEPCGLTQLYAMRYGASPVVTAVGGLVDTVEPANLARGTGTGFLARHADVWELLVALDDALVAYNGGPALTALRQRCMARDSSWEPSARAYVERAYRR
jgi:starch synthase